MLNLHELAAQWPSLLLSGIIGFISGRLLKRVEFQREHAGIRQQLLSLLCRIEEAAKKVQSPDDVASVRRISAMLEARVYSAECATGLLGTRSLNALYDDFTAIQALSGEAELQSRGHEDSTRTLTALASRAAVARHRLGQNRPIHVFRDPQEAVRRFDRILFWANVAVPASLVALIVSVYAAGILRFVFIPLQIGFVISFLVSTAVLIGHISRKRWLFAAKSVSDRISGRQKLMYGVIVLVGYFALATGVIAFIADAGLLALGNVLTALGGYYEVLHFALWWSASASAFVILLWLSIRYVATLGRESRFLAMANLDGICKYAPRSSEFGGKPLCRCTGAECVSQRLAL